MAKKITPFDDANTTAAVKMYKAGKSVAEIARHFHSYGNPIRTRLEKAGVYQGRTAAATVSAKTTRSDTVAPANSGVTVSAAIDAITKTVATALFGDAQLAPQPMTRTEMFDKLHSGVEEGVKKAGIGFHAGRNGKGKRA